MPYEKVSEIFSGGNKLCFSARLVSNAGTGVSEWQATVIGTLGREDLSEVFEQDAVSSISLPPPSLKGFCCPTNLHGINNTSGAAKRLPHPGSGDGPDTTALDRQRPSTAPPMKHDTCIHSGAREDDKELLEAC
ncbi:hypothetical protein HPB50_010301 [Hyalomma asiaticum]|uniref:Uncharacterized protein n=1 Tax=Hyalomma asiaticum TaxID=266040 RepID=A0ACB7TI04_HYAAI|nr:hypothetical protein HPB50_010301 [Hyalomma asiaticum]